MDKNNSEKKAGFFQKLIDAVRSMLGGGSNKTAETTAVSTPGAQELSRVEMLEMLVELGKENAKLKADIEEKNRMLEKQNLFLQAARKMTPVLTMEEEVQLDSQASTNRTDADSIELENRVAEAELKALEAHVRIKEADQRAAEAQAKLEKAEARIEEAELKARKAAAMAKDAEQRARTAEEKAAQAEQRFHAVGDAGKTGIRSEEAEKKEEAAKNPENAVMPVEPTEKAADLPGIFDETIEEEPEALRGVAESDELFDSPAPGSFAAMIAARAAEAAIRERTVSRVRAEENATEEQAVAEERIKAKQTEDERIAEAFEENLNENSVEEAQNPEPVAKAMKEVSDKKEPEKEPLKRISERVPMREAARRAGLVK